MPRCTPERRLRNLPKARVAANSTGMAMASTAMDDPSVNSASMAGALWRRKQAGINGKDRSGVGRLEKKLLRPAARMPALREIALRRATGEQRAHGFHIVEAHIRHAA